MTKKRRLIIPLKGEYFKEIQNGQKPEEFRLITTFWINRLRGREYDEIELTWGYPSADNKDRRLIIPWRGVRETIITHPHFGPDPVEVFAIRVLP